MKTCTSGSIGRLNPLVEPERPPLSLLRLAAVSLFAEGGSLGLAAGPWALPDRTVALPKATWVGLCCCILEEPVAGGLGIADPPAAAAYAELRFTPEAGLPVLTLESTF